MSRMNLQALQAQQAQAKAVREQKLAAALADSQKRKQDNDLAITPGKSPEQVAARQRTSRLFCEIHLPEEKAPEREARLAGIDYTMPVRYVNGRDVNLNPPASTGFLGFGAKRVPAYFVSSRYPPKKPDDPIYAFEYYPVKKG